MNLFTMDYKHRVMKLSAMKYLRNAALLCIVVVGVLWLVDRANRCSEILICPNRSITISKCDLPSVRGGVGNENHPVVLTVSDKAFADDVYFACSILLSRGVWRNVRLKMEDGSGVPFYYGEITDYKAGNQCDLEIKCTRTKIVASRYAGEQQERVLERTSDLGDLFGKSRRSWSMGIWCSEDYPFSNVKELCQNAVCSGCDRIFFAVVADGENRE